MNRPYSNNSLRKKGIVLQKKWSNFIDEQANEFSIKKNSEGVFELRGSYGNLIACFETREKAKKFRDIVLISKKKTNTQRGSLSGVRTDTKIAKEILGEDKDAS